MKSQNNINYNVEEHHQHIYLSNESSLKIPNNFLTSDFKILSVIINLV